MADGTDKYQVPSGDGQGVPLILDLARVAQAQVRLQEVSFVNTHKAPELLAVFNKAWGDLQKMHTKLTYEKDKAFEFLKEVKADVRLKLNDDEVKKRGFAKSGKDLRDALVEVEPEVKEAKERLRHIQAVTSFIAGKMTSFTNGYNSVKKLIGLTPNTNISHQNHRDPGLEDPFGDRTPEQAELQSLFGPPK